MSNRKLLAGVLVIFSCLFLAACSDDSENEETAEQNVEATEDVFYSVLESNVKALMEKDLDGYMETIHPYSPAYDSTEETIQEFFEFSLDIELNDLEVKEQSDDRAVVAYAQRTVDKDGSEFENNETIGEHVLQLDDGKWKIYESEIIEVNPLPAEREAIEITGDYANEITSLPTPFEEEEWLLASYEEGEGETTAEYIPVDENLGNYSAIITYDYYENGNEISGLANFISVLELSLEDMTTGEFEFERFGATESEVMYQFRVDGDATEPNQEEIGRIFVKENDLYVVRYTVMEESIEDVDEIIEMLQEIQ
ncbi:hypothetical protein [Oceanobacillus alkalisoli]|uniref:hypothetical protein n=1 Tax=Oceanobacillus alkalisoli TaxID=2925113 RepID=UPI001EF08E27|nr:hypothetical protein [Oceanobacillus alkalisoli]MCF3943168.1 hypothetical protein [Oceanobacillus alkalisoli]MCG5105351.1 hypothetical protein [Oceanobacillus alkalisoli]